MNYRKIWVQSVGPIPVDENGTSFEIHHKDGNRSNNNISNLSCISIKDHFLIHHYQGDHQAAQRILGKIKNIEILNTLGYTPKTYTKYLIDNHLGLFSPESKAKSLKTKQERKVGFCHDVKWSSIGGKLGGPIGAKITNEIHKKNGTGVYSRDHQSKAGKLGGAIAGRLHRGKTKPLITCPWCGTSGGGQALMNRWHFDNCKIKIAKAIAIVS